MFKCKACASRQEEIKFLRSQVVDLTARLMAFTEKAMDYESKLATIEQSPTFFDPLGKIQSVEAETKEEEAQKEQAKKEMMQIFGAAAGNRCQ